MHVLLPPLRLLQRGPVVAGARPPGQTLPLLSQPAQGRRLLLVLPLLLRRQQQRQQQQRPRPQEGQRGRLQQRPAAEQLLQPALPTKGTDDV